MESSAGRKVAEAAIETSGTSRPRAHEGQRHEDEQRQPDRDRPAREQSRPARGPHGHDQRILSGLMGFELLPESVDHEHRVVDCDREADQGDDVRHVDGHVHVVGEDPDDPDGGRDADRGEGERDPDRGQSAEHEGEHDQGDRDRDRLPFAEVAVVDLLRVVVDRRKARHIGRRPRDVGDRPAHSRGLVRRVGVLERGVDLDIGEVGIGDQHAAGLAVREDLGALGRGGCQLLVEGGAGGDRLVRLRNQREGAVAPLVQAVLDQVEAVLRIGAGHAEAVAQQAADVGDPIDAEDEQGQPEDDDLLAVADHPARPGFQVPS
jgi:hypothetical protein